MSSNHVQRGKFLRHAPMKRQRHQKCSTTGKVRYSEKIDAQIALANATRPTRRNDQNRPKEEKRVFRCPSCHGWHLTSKRTWKPRIEQEGP